MKSMAKSKKKSKKSKSAPTPEAPPVEAAVESPEADPTPVNTDLPGIEGPGVSLPRFRDLDKATAAYIAARDSRMALTEEEVNAKSALSALMHEHNLTTYRYDDYKVVILPGKENLKVKNAADDVQELNVGGGEDGEGDGE